MRSYERRLLTWAVVLTAMAAGIAHAQTTPLVVATPVACATSVDGSVVGLPNPLATPVVAAQYTGTLPAGNYFTKIGWYDAAGHVTLAGPEVQTQLSGSGALVVSLPTSGMPAGALGMDVYIGVASGAETLQGTTTGSAAFTQSAALASGTALPGTNTTVCNLVANDAGWPTGTGYGVTMTAPSGAVQPGYPLTAQFIGPGTEINVGQGFPQYSGTVLYPVPLLARPYNHAQQSVSGPLSMTGYAITQVGKLGVGTSVPAWPIDVETGAINASAGYIYNGGQGVATGNCLVAGSDSYKTFTPGACATLPTLYYQTVQQAGTNEPQRTKLNFALTLTVADDPSNGRTTVSLPNLGSAGTYSFPSSITTDAYGRITAITGSGSGSTVANNVFGNRFLGVAVQNTSGFRMTVYTSFKLNGSYGQETAVRCSIGATSTSLSFFSIGAIFNDAGQSTTSCTVPPNQWYAMTQDNTNLPNPQPPILIAWWEVIN